MGCPTVAIAILTYNREREIRRTIAALLDYVTYGGPLVWFIGDDGSPEGYTQRLAEDYPDLNLNFTITNREGWGANANKLLRIAFRVTDYVFFIEDDYVAKRPIDLNRGMALLQERDDIGIVRYDGIQGHTLTLHLKELQNGMSYLVVDKGSPHLNVYSNRPHLITQKCFKHYGRYVTQRSLGETEENYAHRFRGKQGPETAVLHDGILCAFDHIGATYQGTEEDPWKNKIT